MAHLWRDPDKPNLPFFTLKNVIPCEYDVIDCPWNEGVVVLRKDEPTGMKVRAYFSAANVLTHYFEDYTILDRDILEMRSADGSFLFDGRNGRMFCHHENVSVSTFDAPSTEEEELDRFEVGGRGIVIATLGKRNSMIYYNGKQALPYYHEGEAHPIFKATSCDSGDRPVIDGFLIEENDSMVILSNDCERIHTDDLANVQVLTRLDAYSVTGNQDVVFQFDGEIFCCEKIMDEIFKNCNELFEADDE